MSITKQIPKLRFSEFTEDWESKKYNEIYSFYSTNSLSRDKLNYENGVVKNIHYGDIHTKFSTLFDITKESVPFINDEVDIFKIKKENYLKNGDLLIADASEDYNDIGKTIEVVNLNNEKVISGLHTFHARPNKHKMIIGFSGFMLQSWNVRKQVMKIAQGTKVLGLATSRLGEIKLHIPYVEEQQKIASFLSSVDTKLNLLQQKKDRLEHYKKGVMQQIFSQQLRFKDANGNSFADWEEKKLKNVSIFLDEKRKPIKSSERSKIKGKYPYYGASGIIDYVNDFIFDDELILLGEDGENIISRNLPLAFRVSGKCWVNNHAHVIKPNIDTNIDFLTYSLERVNYVKYNTGTAQPKLNKQVCGNIPLMIPCLEEQTKIATFLSAIDNKIALVVTQIENTQQFKKGLLQQMFV